MGELDPLNRRLGAQKKPDVVVQVVILAEDNEIRDKLAEHDLHVQTIAEVAPIEVSVFGIGLAYIPPTDVINNVCIRFATGSTSSCT